MANLSPASLEGSNGALDHFNHEKEKGNIYPLVVKLGTITPQGADVYSYHPDEDGMVHLKKKNRLRFFSRKFVADLFVAV